MKKYISLFLIVILMLSFAACKATTNKKPEIQTNSETTSSTVSTNENVIKDITRYSKSESTDNVVFTAPADGYSDAVVALKFDIDESGEKLERTESGLGNKIFTVSPEYSWARFNIKPILSFSKFNNVENISLEYFFPNDNDEYLKEEGNAKLLKYSQGEGTEYYAAVLMITNEYGIEFTTNSKSEEDAQILFDMISNHLETAFIQYDENLKVKSVTKSESDSSSVDIENWHFYADMFVDYCSDLCVKSSVRFLRENTISYRSSMCCDDENQYAVCKITPLSEEKYNEKINSDGATKFDTDLFSETYIMYDETGNSQTFIVKTKSGNYYKIDSEYYFDSDFSLEQTEMVFDDIQDNLFLLGV